MRILATILALLLSACADAPEPQRAEQQPSAGIMSWPDLLERDQPQPDATIAYGDDPLQLVDIWKPQDGAAIHPAVIMIHGGCWQTDIAQRDIMNWIAADLRDHGVGVWNIEYRGVDRGGGYPETYLDVGRAADLFAEKAVEYGFMQSKIVVIGHSAGGHLALWLANRPKLAVDTPLRGEKPVRPVLAISQGGLPDLRAGELRDGHPCGTEAPKRMAQSQYERTSPPQMEVGEARQLLFNNDEDRIAPPDYAESYKAKMAAKGVTVEIVETAGEGHVELIAPDSRSWAKQRELILSEFDLR